MSSTNSTVDYDVDLGFRHKFSLLLVLSRSTYRGEIFRNSGQSPRGEYPSSCRYQISLQHSVGYVERNLPAKNQLDSSSRFDTIPACGGQTSGRTDRRTHDDRIYRARMASRGKNVPQNRKTGTTRTCAHVRRDWSKAVCQLQ